MKVTLNNREEMLLWIKENAKAFEPSLHIKTLESKGLSIIINSVSNRGGVNTQLSYPTTLFELYPVEFTFEPDWHMKIRDEKNTRALKIILSEVLKRTIL